MKYKRQIKVSDKSPLPDGKTYHSEYKGKQCVVVFKVKDDGQIRIGIDTISEVIQICASRNGKINEVRHHVLADTRSAKAVLSVSGDYARVKNVEYRSRHHRNSNYANIIEINKNAGINSFSTRDDGNDYLVSEDNLELLKTLEEISRLPATLKLIRERIVEKNRAQENSRSA